MADREYMRKLLDEVLGAERNKLPDQSGDFGLKYSDDAVRPSASLYLSF